MAFGAVLRIWHDYRERGMEDPDAAELPPMDELEKASEHTDINKVVIDEETSTVFLADPEMSLDVGAIAKGYAVEQVSRIAAENGFTTGLISVGGNVRAIGSKENAGKLGMWASRTPTLKKAAVNSISWMSSTLRSSPAGYMRDIIRWTGRTITIS